MRALIEKALFAFEVWRLKRKLFRVSPALREIDRLEREAKRRHKSSGLLAREHRRLVHDQLVREIGGRRNG